MQNNDQLLKYLFDKADWDLIPHHMIQPTKDWVEHGWSPGGFLSAILEHDFYDAIFQADGENQTRIVQWAQFLAWFLPSACHGSPEVVRKWKAQGGLRGLEDKPKLN
jgi:hypothetical protein